MKSPKDVLALGQAIVRELQLDQRGAVLERWLAHHLAEVLAEVDTSVGPAKAAAEKEAVNLILKLWRQRRELPERVDPLGGYRKAIEVLGKLMPEANPWRFHQREGTYEDLLRLSFDTMSRIVAGGVVLVQREHDRLVD